MKIHELIGAPGFIRRYGWTGDNCCLEVKSDGIYVALTLSQQTDIYADCHQRI